MRPPSAMTKRHVQGLSASLPLPQTVAKQALTFDSLHSRSSHKSWRSRKLSLKLKSRPTTSHHSLNLKLCRPNSGKSLGQFDYNVRIVAPQEWPHLHVPFVLTKKKFKDVLLAEFVYGYLDIMQVASDEQQEVMSSHLMELMRLAAKYEWLSVLSFHAAVLDRIEAGLAFWGDDFTELERFNITEFDRLPLPTKQQNQPTARPPGFTPKTYCREWNRTGTCSNQSHQVGSEHVCAYCKLPDHTIASYPTLPTTTNASPAASPSLS